MLKIKPPLSKNPMAGERIYRYVRVYEYVPNMRAYMRVSTKAEREQGRRKLKQQLEKAGITPDEEKRCHCGGELIEDGDVVFDTFLDRYELTHEELRCMRCGDEV